MVHSADKSVYALSIPAQLTNTIAMDERVLNVFDLPQNIDPLALAGSVVVVIDLLRASTTICQALASGAREVVPFLEVDETLAAAAKCERSDIVLGGERSGGKIKGFDLGNSPAEYTCETVGGRRVLITTTNGTRRSPSCPIWASRGGRGICEPHGGCSVC